jgi:dienelactone hydrolase
MRKLDPKGAIPPGMTRVPGGDSPAGKLPGHLMDVHEVSNREFKAFVDGGGYTHRKYWKQPFVSGEKALTFEQAIAKFLDASGHPGPSTWYAGSYPSGHDADPVSGVSWYEAAAYAEFVGKALPTIHHWALAAIPPNAWGGFGASVLPLSNFGEGLVATGSTQAMTSFGSYDMIGNVREWCSNEYGQGRAIRGCAWDDSSYNYELVVTASPFDRDPRNGFRCVRYLDVEGVPAAAFGPFAGYLPARDYYADRPVSDEVFRTLMDRFSFDKTDLDPRSERRDETSQEWIVEKVNVAAAYDRERLPIFLYIPKHAQPPFQAIVYYPGSDMFMTNEEALSAFELAHIDFIIKSGRIVVFPVYKGALERNDEESRRYSVEDESMATRRYADYLTMKVKDFTRTLDYLATRSDIDTSKIAYYGFSEGGLWAPMFITAAADRIKVSVLHLGGLYHARFQAQADPLNYVTRVKVPTLMLNGIYDTNLTLKECVEPMYTLLGTPEKDKVLKLYPSDHFIPKNELIKETLAWYDKYLGPVRR